MSARSTATAAAVVDLTDRRAAKQHVAAAAKSDLIDQLRADIATELTTLVEQATQLRAIAGTRHRVGPRFLSPATRERLDDQVREDRKARRTLPVRVDKKTGEPVLGQDWLNRDTALAGVGEAPAPAQPAITSADADILFTLQHWVQRLARILRDQLKAADAGQFCLWPAPPAAVIHYDLGADVDVLADQLRLLVAGYSDRHRLERILRELTWSSKQAAEVIQGPARTEHSDPCPWCGRRSLVVHHRDENGAELNHQIIRCERLDVDHACECDDPVCSCHTANGGNPYSHRHEWSGAYNRRHHGSLDYLRILIDEAQEIRAMETRATDRLHAIAALHTPTYGDHQLYGYIPWTDRYLPAGHVCVQRPTNLAEKSVSQQADADHNGHWCIPGRRHYVLGCIECNQRTPSDALVIVEPWPCPTWQLTQLDLPDPATES